MTSKRIKINDSNPHTWNPELNLISDSVIHIILGITKNQSLTAEEIASRMSCSLKTVENRIDILVKEDILMEVTEDNGSEAKYKSGIDSMYVEYS
ncbi:MAG: hypothetical protein ABEK59_08600 [Halobacteria archaeon]